LSEWLDNKKQSIRHFHKLLQERTEKANPRRKLTVEEAKRLNKLESIADKLKRGENVQNRQLQTWLSDEEYAQRQTHWTYKLSRTWSRRENAYGISWTQQYGDYTTLH